MMLCIPTSQGYSLNYHFQCTYCRLSNATMQAWLFSSKWNQSLQFTLSLLHLWCNLYQEVRSLWAHACQPLCSTHKQGGALTVVTKSENKVWDAIKTSGSTSPPGPIRNCRNWDSTNPGYASPDPSNSRCGYRSQCQCQSTDSDSSDSTASLHRWAGPGARTTASCNTNATADQSKSAPSSSSSPTAYCYSNAPIWWGPSGTTHCCTSASGPQQLNRVVLQTSYKYDEHNCMAWPPLSLWNKLVLTITELIC